MNKTLISLLLVSAAYGQAAHYQESSVQKINVIVESQVQNYDKKQIVSKLLTQVGAPFYQEDFDSDLKLLAQDFDDVQPSLSEEDGQVTITLFLTPKPIISRVEFVGNESVRDSALRKEMEIEPLSKLSKAQIEQELTKLRDFYIKKGFFESKISFDLKDLEDGEAILKVYVSEGRSGKIHKMRFNGLSRQQRKEIKELIQTSKYIPLYSWVVGNGVYHEEMLENDKMMMVNFLQNQGYADVDLNIRIVDSNEKQGMVDVVVDVRLGSSYKIGEVSFGGNDILSDDQIEKAIEITKGQTYSLDTIRNTQQAIQDLYNKLGYIDTNVHYETHLDPNEKSYSVRYEINPTEKYRIGLVRVVGNEKTTKRVILHESLLVPGEVFDARKLRATERRLYAIGYFKRVNVYAAKPSSEASGPPYYRDVYIEVEETSTGSFNMFGGYSTKDDMFVGVELGEKNFNIRGAGKLFTRGPSALRGGGEYAHLRLNIGGQETLYTASWMTPYFRDTLWRLGFELFKKKINNYSPLYDVRSYGTVVNASYPLNAFWTVGTSYSLKTSNNLIPENGVEVKTDTGTKRLTPEEIKALIPPDGTTSAVAVNAYYDSTNSASRPTQGFRSNIEGSVAGLGGSFKFIKLSYLNSYYVSLNQYGILKWRADFKYIIPFGKTKDREDANRRGIPVSDRFFMGGIGSVRGYKTNIIGPNINDAPIGGLSSILFSIEYMYDIFPPMIQFFVFHDSGGVSESENFWINQFKREDFKRSVGAGFRLDLFGQLPLTIGVAYPISRNFPFKNGSVRGMREYRNYEKEKGRLKEFFITVGAQY